MLPGSDILFNTCGIKLEASDEFIKSRFNNRNFNSSNKKGRNLAKNYIKRKNKEGLLRDIRMSSIKLEDYNQMVSKKKTTWI